jgi:hypothetical protein
MRAYSLTSGYLLSLQLDSSPKKFMFLSSDSQDAHLYLIECNSNQRAFFLTARGNFCLQPLSTLFSIIKEGWKQILAIFYAEKSVYYEVRSTE